MSIDYYLSKAFKDILSKMIEEGSCKTIGHNYQVILKTKDEVSCEKKYEYFMVCSKCGERRDI